MGHCSSIALGIALAKPQRKVVCIDGHDIHMGGGNVHCITQQQPKGHL